MKLPPPNAAAFDSTPEFRHFKEVMRKLMTVPKAELDALVKAAKEASPRRVDPHAPVLKRAKKPARLSRFHLKLLSMRQMLRFLTYAPRRVGLWARCRLLQTCCSIGLPAICSDGRRTREWGGIRRRWVGRTSSSSVRMGAFAPTMERR